jgi:hypothetical protein
MTVNPFLSRAHESHACQTHVYGEPTTNTVLDRVNLNQFLTSPIFPKNPEDQYCQPDFRDYLEHPSINGEERARREEERKKARYRWAETIAIADNLPFYKAVYAEAVRRGLISEDGSGEGVSLRPLGGSSIDVDRTEGKKAGGDDVEYSLGDGGFQWEAIDPSLIMGPWARDEEVGVESEDDAEDDVQEIPGSGYRSDENERNDLGYESRVGDRKLLKGKAWTLESHGFEEISPPLIAPRAGRVVTGNAQLSQARDRVSTSPMHSSLIASGRRAAVSHT